MALPFLPGQVFNSNLGKEKFHKTHQFDYRNEVSSYVGEDKCGIGGDVLPGQKLKPRHSKFPKGVGAEAPAWVAFDRQVLCFDAYFQEAVQEKREEQFRVRRCKIYFYLEDDSIQVIEPKVENSGIPQGTLIRRHRIPLPPPHDEEFYTVEHFNVGKEIQLYSKTFKITDCDEFTQNFIGKLGVRIGQQDSIPKDPYSNARKEMTESMQPLRPYEKYDTLKQFLQYDTKVLRFYCLWDDADSMFGDAREMVMHYFLADDTVEIREVIPRNSGRDAAPVFLRRQRLPKEPTPLYQPGTTTDRTVLNVFGPMGHGGRWILDSLKTGAINTECYKDSDITLGTVLNVWGRPIMVCDCDEFTKEYYRSRYGVQEFKSINYKTPHHGQSARDLPPYNGFGSEEDSLANCLNLIPKPPKRDFIKFMEKDRHGLDSNIIRFMARMDTTRPIDMGRRFIISYFLSDDTILVFEPQQRNSGIVEGKFLERGRVLKPYGNDHYNARDLFIGAIVQFYKHKFLLIDADEYAVDYMEKNKHEFPHANIDYILPKLRKLAEEKGDEIRSFFSSYDQSNSGRVRYEPFRELIKKVGGDMFSEHEIITICRHYGAKKSEEVDLNTIVATIQEKLRKANYEYFSNMSDLFKHRDKSKCGFLTPREFHNVCKSFSLPVKAELLDALLQYVEVNEQGMLNYAQFVHFLNWQEAPVVIKKFSPSKAPDSLQPKERSGPLNNLDNIVYKVILEDLFLKD